MIKSKTVRKYRSHLFDVINHSNISYKILFVEDMHIRCPMQDQFVLSTMYPKPRKKRAVDLKS